MTLTERCLQIIGDTARIPSFSSFEERLHPYLLDAAEKIPGCEITVVAERNLLFYVPGKRPGLVALTAHLDKIDHFGPDCPAELPFTRTETELQGQMDNTAGIGITMSLLEQAPQQQWPGLLVLLSEMEESKGLREHPERLRDAGKGLTSGMGAERLARHLIDEALLPDAVITVDTTPLFRGEPGCALYTGHWEFTKTDPTPKEQARTLALADRLTELDPLLYRGNNTNDYLTYGKVLNEETGPETAVPSVALEPAIFPYHQRDERVFIADIDRILGLLASYLGTHQPF
ncbi:MAG: hypothetical protein LAT75_00245 [Candidatus Cyclonatronum sp.]|uniref:hypothetical protein n=1 Tax=Cyclonatronum sp. TaxID=3024185 RepID=UPI0025C38241|nr:hypothetical protein [Cyclonatronum sp.]MCH8485261.1 hypothetical protein [Cyclonatronum sp.]